jgi:hypothetical protein
MAGALKAVLVDTRELLTKDGVVARQQRRTVTCLQKEVVLKSRTVGCVAGAVAEAIKDRYQVREAR